MTNVWDDLDKAEERWVVAVDALTSSRIVGIVRHPAAYEFTLADGRVVTLYPGDRDYPDTWKVS